MEKSRRVITSLSPGKHDKYLEFIEKKTAEGISEAEILRSGLRVLAEKENFSLCAA
ncbi:MAG: hypothetical protein M0R03_20815 [Novosphingobium sp.]|jgi:hypothetical protein|nr:hypothetical protein [Novosphingobium sp.]